VSCAAAKSCLAVGYVDIDVNVNDAYTGQAAATRWNGESWAATTVPAPGQSKGKASAFNAVSCPATGRCVAVGQLGPYDSDKSGGVAGFWNGKSWKLGTTP